MNKISKIELDMTIKILLVLGAIIFLIIFMTALRGNIGRIGDLIKDIVGGVM